LLKFRLHILMAERGPGRPYQIQEVANATGLQANTISGIYNNRYKRIALDTVDKLCKFLNCTPGEFFEYDPAE